MNGLFETQSRHSLKAMLAFAGAMNSRAMIEGKDPLTGFSNASLINTAINDSCAPDGILMLGSSLLPLSPDRSVLTAYTTTKHGVEGLKPENLLGLQIYRYHPLMVLSALVSADVLATIGGKSVALMETRTEQRRIPVFMSTMGAFISQLISIGGLIKKSRPEFITRSAYLQEE